jgi:DNA replication protein DnaC
MSPSLESHLKQLKLPGFALQYREMSQRAEREGWGFETYLQNLTVGEIEHRRQKRLEKHLRASKLPKEKSLGQIDVSRLPTAVRRRLQGLCEGTWVSQGENLLLFGLPGRGKTHLACAIGHELIQRGYTVYLTPAYALVQRLLAAKKRMELEKDLHKLDAFDLVILDSCAVPGYVESEI